MKILAKKYPDPKTELNYTSTFELLVATILSAQTTDKQVNKVTKYLFKKYNMPADYAALNPEELEKEIKSIGLYHNKSRYLIDCSKILIEKYNGIVPGLRKELIKLPGVGRKTANVILINAFNVNAFPVDTHVKRVSLRLGLASSNKPVEIEKELCKIVPENKWGQMHHWLIFHGRKICKARNPHCKKCILKKYCKKFQMDT